MGRVDDETGFPWRLCGNPKGKLRPDGRREGGIQVSVRTSHLSKVEYIGTFPKKGQRFLLDFNLRNFKSNRPLFKPNRHFIWLINDQC